MISASSRLWVRNFAGFGLFVFAALPLLAQRQEHGRNYKPPPPTAHIVVTVEKNFNAKPLVNAAVIFHAIKDGKDTGNMEVKTDSNGQAMMDFIEAGSHVTVQVFADGFATFAQDFDVTTEEKDLLVKLMRPQAQVSDYEDNDGKLAQTKPGIQEHVPGTLPFKPAPAPSPTPPSPTPANPVAGSPAAAAAGPQQ